MKKWLLLLIAVLAVVAIYLYARQQKYTPPWEMPKYGKITRGDIRVPITASGLIHADKVIEMKPEASGEVVSVPVVEGDFVHKDDPLVILDPDDEQRIRDRAQADFDRAEAMLTQARVAVDRAKVNIESALAHKEELQAQGAITLYELDKVEKTLDANGRSELYSDQQVHDTRYRARLYEAQLRSAEIAIDAARLAQQDAEAAVKSQEATVRAAKKNVEDADERLSETTVRAPQDAIVTQVTIKPGMLVQSGTTSIMGGTPLMMLADVSKKKVIARLDEADFGRVLDISPLDSLPEMPGLRAAAEQDADTLVKRAGGVKLTVDAFPEEEFEGRIERVEPQGKLNAGASIIQFDVHIEITDPQRHRLPLGAQAQVEFTVESAVNVLRVPAEAVKTLDDQRGIWLKTTPDPGSTDRFGKRFVPCRFGITDGEFTHLIDTVGGDELTEDTEIYTKLPPDPSERER